MKQQQTEQKQQQITKQCCHWLRMLILQKLVLI